MNSIELHIFTNSTWNAPSTKIIEETYKSFLSTFSFNGNVTVWCDFRPNKEKSSEYIDNLRNIFPEVNVTRSLSDGYINAVKNSESDFLFMLEHDWEFLPTIKHNLNELMNGMIEEHLVHLRFNQRTTTVKKSDEWLIPKGGKYFDYCITPSVSNNPHIIDRKKYEVYALPLLKVEHGSLGIEHVLNKSKLHGAIYGIVQYPACVKHLDGKRRLNN
jgi:hypothetical protein